MNSDKFFSILRLLEKYTYLHIDDGEFVFDNESSTDGEPRFIIVSEKLQTNYLNKDRNWEDYEYFFHDRETNQVKPFAKVHAFLQGAIRDSKDNKSTSCDESFLDYQKSILKLFFGMFVFIDPTKSQSPDKQMPYYLLGPMIGKPLQPSFNLKLFYNIQNIRGNYEFIEPPVKWLRFFLAFNEFTRDTLTFDKQDFVRLFNFDAYKEKRNETIERRNNILYISSGEMDYCILQWLMLYIKQSNPQKKIENILSSIFSFDLQKMYPGIKEFYDQNSSYEYIVPNYHSNSEYTRKKYITPSKKLQVWLRLWGLLDTNYQPTERLLAVFEWLYYYLLRDDLNEDEKKKYYDFRNYLNLVEIDEKDPEYHYLSNLDQKKRKKYLEIVENLLPVKTNYKWETSSTKQSDFTELIQLFFEIQYSWNETHIKLATNRKTWEVFSERCRFRPFIHFLYRNFPSSVEHNFIEKTCRGFIAFPILKTNKNTPDSTEKKEINEVQHVGYFLGHFKDSDSKGRCAFNWHKNSEYEVSQTVNNTYEDIFFELRYIVNQLGRIEREQIYYRGIVKMHEEETQKQSLHSAIAACMSRNLSHTTGSHKSPWFKNFISEYFKELNIYNKSSTVLPKTIATAIRSLSLPKEYDTEKKILILNSHLLNYFDFINDNMEFIADVTTSYSSNKITFNYSIKEIYEEYRSLKLMHHGLFDDKGMETSIKFLAVDDKTNEYLDAAVALPNGQLGKTAIFIIIENILRNFYKHTIRETAQPEFYIKVTSSVNIGNDFWCIDFFDNINTKGNKNKRGKTLLDKINTDYINNSILQTNGTLRPEGWGFIEMKACAAYLVNYPIEHIDKHKNEAELIILNTDVVFNPLLEANYYTNDGFKVVDFDEDLENRNLGYRFYLKKAKKVGIEEQNHKNNTSISNKIATHSKEGIHLLKKNNLTNRTQHDILLLNESHPDIDKNQRCFIIKKADRSVLEETREIELFAWEKYIESQFKNKILNYSIVKNKDELEKTTLNTPPKNIFFIDNHSRYAKQEELSFNHLKKYLWYLPYENRTKKDIELFFKAKYDRLLQLKLIEVINTKISIFDERIQQETNVQYNNLQTITLRELHQLGNVYIPNIENESLTNERVIFQLEEIIKKRLTNDDYVIIHFTLFEKLADHKGYNTSLKGDKNLKNYYEKLVKEWKLEKKGKVIAFCSGRGKPSNLFNGCYYIHLSTLQYFTVRTLSKFSLVNILKSLRKT